MITVGVFEAKEKLSALLALVLAGQEVIITRRKVPIVRLVVFNLSPDQKESIE